MSTMKSSPLSLLIQKYQMIPPKSVIFLGVSGGADSICLLHQLYFLQDVLDFKLVALHLNHQLRGDESGRDETFVRDFIAKYCPEAELIVEKIPVSQLAKEKKLGIEEMARLCRYEFFQKHAHTVENSRIATAHHLNDNGETVLMNLTRGAGILGLSGIPPVRGNIIRPLLTTPRQEILDYLRRNSLPHIEDSSNLDVNYTRNRFRHEVMPILSQQNPNFLQNIAEISPILRQEDEILNQPALESLPEIAHSASQLSLSASQLSQMPAALALRGIQILTQRLQPDLILELKHRQGILALCENSNPSASLNLPCGLMARRQYDQLIFTRPQQSPTLAEQMLILASPQEFILGEYHILITQEIYLGDGDSCNFWIAGQYQSLLIRPRREGDRLKRPNRPEKTLKSLMIDEKVPRHLRDAVPVFCAGDDIVAVVGLGVNQAALPALDSVGWHIKIKKL